MKDIVNKIGTKIKGVVDDFCEKRLPEIDIWNVNFFEKYCNVLKNCIKNI